MAALTTENGNKVWQKVKNALSAANASPASQDAFMGLKVWLGTQGRNPDLQFAPIDGTLASSDGGAADSVLASGALKVYAIWLKKAGTVETIFKGSNHATVAGSDGTQDIAIGVTTGANANGNGDDYVGIYPAGRALSLGLTVAQFTTRTGATRTLIANSMNGFAILGA